MTKSFKMNYDDLHDPMKLESLKTEFQKKLLTMVEHSQDLHANCDPQSRCKRDVNYEMSTCRVEDPVAIGLLTAAVKSSRLYQHAEKFLYFSNTSNLESYHNAMLRFSDKRICMSNERYELSANLASLYWNMNTRKSTVKNGTSNGKFTDEFAEYVWERYCLKRQIVFY